MINRRMKSLGKLILQLTPISTSQRKSTRKQKSRSIRPKRELERLKRNSKLGKRKLKRPKLNRSKREEKILSLTPKVMEHRDFSKLQRRF